MQSRVGQGQGEPKPQAVAIVLGPVLNWWEAVCSCSGDQQPASKKRPRPDFPPPKSDGPSTLGDMSDTRPKE